MFSLLEVETGGLDLPVCLSAHVCTDSKLFFLLEVETGGLDLPVCTSAHVWTGSHHTRISHMAGRERYFMLTIIRIRTKRVNVYTVADTATIFSKELFDN